MNTEKIIIQKDEIRNLYLLTSQLADIHTQMQKSISQQRISDLICANGIYLDELIKYIEKLALEYKIVDLPKV